MTRTLLAAAAALALTAAPGLADPLEGRWRTSPDDNGNTGIVEVTPCGNAFCGVLIQAYDAAGNPMQSDNVGRQIIWNTKPRGGGEYRGKIYSPDRDATYNSRLQLNGDRVKPCGRRLGFERCGGDWTRVN